FLNATRTGASPLLEKPKVIYQTIPLASDPSRAVAAESDSVVLLDFSRADPRERTISGFPEPVIRLAFDQRGTLWGSFFRGGLFSLDHIESDDPIRRFFLPGTDLPAGFD